MTTTKTVMKHALKNDYGVADSVGERAESNVI